MTTPRASAGSADASAPTAFAELADLSRGEPAPPWLTAGIQERWGRSAPGEAGTPLSVSLITVSENATFIGRRGDEPVLVVRLARPGYVGDVASLASELLWVEALRADTDIATPSPVRGGDGELVQSITDPSGTTWTAVAFEHVAGEVLEDHEDPAPHFTEIARITATLHEHSRAWRLPDGFVRFDWAFTDMVGPRARWGDWEDAPLADTERALLDRAETAALTRLGALEPSPAHWGLIHADLRPSNVMTADGELTIIDFDDSGFSWYLYDFAAAITFYEHRPQALGMAANWLGGYGEVAPLSRADREVAAALSMVRRLTMLGWTTTHRADALPGTLWEEYSPGTLDVAGRYLADPLWLVRDS